MTVNNRSGPSNVLHRVMSAMHNTAMDRLDELSELADSREALRALKDALRDQKKQAAQALESNFFGDGATQELTLTELEDLRILAVEAGSSTSELDQLIALAKSHPDHRLHRQVVIGLDGEPKIDPATGQPLMREDEHHFYLTQDTDWGRDRLELFDKFKASYDEAIDEQIESIGDDDDQLSFKLQLFFSQYSTAMSQTSSTVQVARNIDNQILGKIV